MSEFEKLLAEYRSAVVTHFKVQSDDDLDDKWNARVLELRAALTACVAAKDKEIERLTNEHEKALSLFKLTCNSIDKLEQENAVLRAALKNCITYFESALDDLPWGAWKGAMLEEEIPSLKAALGESR